MSDLDRRLRASFSEYAEGFPAAPPPATTVALARRSRRPAVVAVTAVTSVGVAAGVAIAGAAVLPSGPPRSLAPAAQLPITPQPPEPPTNVRGCGDSDMRLVVQAPAAGARLRVGSPLRIAASLVATSADPCRLSPGDAKAVVLQPGGASFSIDQERCLQQNPPLVVQEAGPRSTPVPGATVMSVSTYDTACGAAQHVIPVLLSTRAGPGGDDRRVFGRWDIVSSRSDVLTQPGTWTVVVSRGDLMSRVTFTVSAP